MEGKPNPKIHSTRPSIRFLVSLVTGRWMAVSVSFYILLFSGATYIFGIYSGSIKTSLHYNQETIDTLSFFKDLGGNVGIVAGLLSEVLPPCLVLSLGSILNLFGYLMIWLSITHRVPRPPVGAMYLYIYTGSNSQTFVHTAVLVSCVKNFPRSRGMVLGLTKGCIGLSGAVFTQFYHALYGGGGGGAAHGDDTRSLVLLIAWLPSLIILIFMWFIRPMDPSTSREEGPNGYSCGLIKEEKQFFSYLYLALLLAGFLMLAIILENVLSLPTFGFKIMGCLTLLLVGSNALVAVRAECETSRRCGQNGTGGHGTTLSRFEMTNVESNDKNTHDKSTHIEAARPDREMAGRPNHKQEQEEGEEEKEQGEDEDEDGCRREDLDPKALPRPWMASQVRRRVRTYFKKDWPQRGDDFTIPQALLSLDFWILLISVTCGVGTALAAIDNMGQIGASLGYPTLSISTCVSLISIWNFLGRVASGFGSDYLLHRYRFSRSLMLTIILALSCIGHLMIAFPGPGTLYVASALVGFCFGALWPPLYAIISEVFGLKYFATLYNVVGITSPLGSYLFNVRVAGYLYDKEARRQGATDSTKDSVCNGVHCFRMTFLIMTMVCAMGCLVSVLLVIRTRKFYSQDIYAKYRVKNHEQDPRDQQCISA